MTIPTEPIGTIRRPLALVEAIAARDRSEPALDLLFEEAIRDTIERFEATGSPVISDDTSTTRDKAFAKIRARVRGTSLAADTLGSGS